MTEKNILILTLSLGKNYGGMLQAYALQKYLKHQGHQVVTTEVSKSGLIYQTVRSVYRLAKRLLHAVKPSPSTMTRELDKYTFAKTMKFVDKYIDTVNGHTVKTSKYTDQYHAIVVGSDQVWRKRYVSIPTYLLDFAENWDVKRISYAASFGKDDLSEYTPEDMTAARELAPKFDAISVREDSAVDLVNQHWGQDAVHHVDPTMLLEKEHYMGLVQEDQAQLKPSAGTLFAYVLDRHEPQNEIIERVENVLGLTEFGILPPKFSTRKELLSNLPKYQYPPVTQWLKSFNDAKFIVTDSFHGTVFSILFHKPFITIGNPRRGMARFESLLRMFGLQDRLVSDESQVTDDLMKAEINWDLVEDRLTQERERSNNYLRSNLGLD